MINQVFINLAVKDLERSKAFFTSLGFSIDDQFSDDTAAGIIFSDAIYAMLITEEKFKKFTPKGLADATKTTEVLTALQVEKKEDVDRIYKAAMGAGATETRPAEDHGFMYAKAFNDPDGHIWEVFWMDISKFPEQA